MRKSNIYIYIYIWPNYSDLSEVTEINFEIDDLACSCHSWFRSNGKKLLGARTVFSTTLSPSYIRTPGPTKAHKTFGGPKSFFLGSCPSHIFEPLVTQKPTKLSGAPKVFFHDPVPVTYSNPWSHKSRQNFPGPQKFFPRSRPSHIFEPLVPQKPTKLSGAPKVFFHDPVPLTYIRTPGPTKADKTFRGPKSFFSRSCPRHIFEPLVPVPQKPTKPSGAPKVFLCTHTHWDKRPPPNPTSRPW